MSKIEEKVETLVKVPINNLGYRLYDVIYSKEGKKNYLRIFIDKDEGISLEDCEKVNNEITDILDEADYIKEQYFLEISSPGIERVIRKDEHLKENINNEIYIKTFSYIANTKEKEVIGILKEFDENNIKLISEDEEVNIKREDIALMKKVYKW